MISIFSLIFLSQNLQKEFLPCINQFILFSDEIRCSNELKLVFEQMEPFQSSKLVINSFDQKNAYHTKSIL